MNGTDTTTVITCDCKVCNGQSARVRGEGTFEGKPYTRTMIHNMVRMAHSPLSRTRSARDFGPWAV